MKYKTHGFQAHPNYEDCPECQKIMQSVQVIKYENGTIGIWNNESDEYDFILLTKSQLIELHRQLPPIVEKIKGKEC